MRRISHSRSFRRDYRREKRGQYGLHLDEQLDAALQLLANDQQIPSRYRDRTTPCTGTGPESATAT